MITNEAFTTTLSLINFEHQINSVILGFARNKAMKVLRKSWVKSNVT